MALRRKEATALHWAMMLSFSGVHNCSSRRHWLEKLQTTLRSISVQCKIRALRLALKNFEAKYKGSDSEKKDAMELTKM
ncbi:unnamed protein product [Urochloa humidicola]